MKRIFRYALVMAIAATMAATPEAKAGNIDAKAGADIQAGATAPRGQQKLTILHTNDTHSHIDPVRGGEYSGLGGVIERAAYIDSVRSAVGRKNLLLLDAGDFSQGSSYFTLMDGDIEVELMNEMKYDVSSLGNHEFDNGTEELARRLKMAKYDVVCANYDFTSLPDLNKYIKPYVICRKGGMKIGVIGLLVDVTRVVDKHIADRLVYLDPIDPVNRYAALLKDKGCDLVIVLSHMGTLGPGSDEEVAARTRNVDIIIGGHSHTFLEEPLYVPNLDGKPTPVVTDGCWGIYVGSLTVTKE